MSLSFARRWQSCTAQRWASGCWHEPLIAESKTTSWILILGGSFHFSGLLAEYQKAKAPFFQFGWNMMVGCLFFADRKAEWEDVLYGCLCALLFSEQTVKDDHREYSRQANTRLLEEKWKCLVALQKGPPPKAC